MIKNSHNCTNISERHAEVIRWSVRARTYHRTTRKHHNSAMHQILIESSFVVRTPALHISLIALAQIFCRNKNLANQWHDDTTLEWIENKLLLDLMTPLYYYQRIKIKIVINSKPVATVCEKDGRHRQIRVYLCSIWDNSMVGIVPTSLSLVASPQIPFPLPQCHLVWLKWSASLPLSPSLLPPSLALSLPSSPSTLREHPCTSARLTLFLSFDFTQVECRRLPARSLYLGGRNLYVYFLFTSRHIELTRLLQPPTSWSVCIIWHKAHRVNVWWTHLLLIRGMCRLLQAASEFHFYLAPFLQTNPLLPLLLTSVRSLEISLFRLSRFLLVCCLHF